MGRTERIFGLREVTRLLGLTARRASQLRRLGILAAADEHGIAMVTTGIRHFRH